MNRHLRHELAFAYRMFEKNHWDDLTYTHLSVRAHEGNAYFILPFGLLFDEVTPENLLKVDFSGRVLEGQEQIYNPTGYITHASIYRQRQDINAVFHSHTTCNVAVSSMKQGLLPLSQWALHFYERIGYHNYDSLVMDPKRNGEQLVDDLGQNDILMMRNHGVVVCGRDIAEAYYHQHHLEQACQVQCCLLSTKAEYVMPDQEVCQRSNQALLGFETRNGHRDWQALKRRHQDIFESCLEN